MRVSPLGVLAAILIVGITIEAVERQNRSAAYALVVLILLGIITFNAKTFTAQINSVMAILNARSKTK